MINISTSHVVAWPAPAGPAVAPVSPVTPVQPVRETGRDAQAGFGAGRDGQGAAPRSHAPRTGSPEPDAATEAAPLLPRGYGPQGAELRSGSAPDALPGGSASTAQQKTAERAEQAAEEQAEAAAERKPPLQAVLTTVWEASAAVVERALGRLSGAEAEVPGVQSDTAPDLGALAAAQMNRRPLLLAAAEPAAAQPMPWPVMPPSDEEPSPHVAPEDAGVVAVEDLVAYDEHGKGSRAPIEAGSVISERV